MKRLFKILFSRMFIVGALLLLQVVILILMVWKLSNHFVYVYAFFSVLSVGIVLWLVNKVANPSVKLPWVIVVMLIPIFGGLFYLMFGTVTLPPKTKMRMLQLDQEVRQACPDHQEVIKKIELKNPQAASQSFYMTNKAGLPVYENTQVEYFPSGEAKFQRLKEELEEAKHFIFLEYFIIQEGIMWNEILEILKRKAAQGVDVRVLYDDVGCLQTLPYHYNRKLEAMGIQCVVFNPFRPALTVVLQNRDHRKIAVIDGTVGFTGGVNLADEYINERERFGHWKDSAVLLRGEGVWSLTLMFLQTWNFHRPKNEDYSKFAPKEYFEADGYVQPYGDTPLDQEYVSEMVYLNMINQATQYLYINTPYFIVDNELITALTLAAKRGVDVRMVTPHIADKWYVHMVTQSYYKQLIASGMKVYEYTPGFIHAKSFVCDDCLATVGTINLDYRSLYHHYECGVWMHETKAIACMKEDFLKTLDVCAQITMDDCMKVPMFKRFVRGIFKVIAPLM